MCTAATYKTKDFYFGRTLDYEFSYGDKVVITPRNYPLYYDAFNENLPLAQLHWIIADKDDCITIESVEEGIKVYDNKVGVLTNNPSFDKQMFNLNNYDNLSTKNKENTFSKNLDLKQYSRGMGAIGLPGDLSSISRFVKVCFTKMNSISCNSEKEGVSQFFHILSSVD